MPHQSFSAPQGHLGYIDAKISIFRKSPITSSQNKILSP